MIGYSGSGHAVELDTNGRQVLVGLVVLPFHIFSFHNRTFLYNVTKIRAFEVDNDIAEGLLLCRGANAIIPRALAAHLREFGLIPDSSEDLLALAGGTEAFSNYIHTLVLNVIQACNLRCGYCFAGDGSYGNKGKMSYEVGRKAIDWYSSQHGGNFMEINFFGGEPLANFHLISKCVDYSKNASSCNGKAITFGLTTNATLVTPHIAKFLAKNKFRIAVSIDGPPTIHDRNRPMASGQTSSRKVLDGIRMLQEAGIAPIARCTVYGETDIVAVRDYLTRIGFRQIHVSNATVSTGMQLDVANAERAHDAILANAVLEREEAHRSNENGQDVENAISKLARQIVGGQRQTRACGIGERIASVGIDGGLYACHRFTNNREWKIGNTSTGMYGKRFKDRSVDEIDKCSACWAKYLCGGGCRHDNFVVGGHAFGPSDTFCREMKAYLEQAIVLACEAPRIETSLQESDAK